MTYLLDRIKAGKGNSTTCNLSGAEAAAAVTIRLLTAQDVLEATLAADRIFRDAEITVSLQNIKEYEAEKDTQRLYRACSDGDGQPLAATITEFRRGLTVADKERLIDRYNRLDEESNPAISKMSDADFDALVETIKKNPSSVSNVSSISTLRRLALCLASAPAS